MHSLTCGTMPIKPSLTPNPRYEPSYRVMQVTCTWPQVQVLHGAGCEAAVRGQTGTDAIHIGSASL